jgi:hypothetical protein
VRADTAVRPYTEDLFHNQLLKQGLMKRNGGPEDASFFCALGYSLRRHTRDASTDASAAKHSPNINNINRIFVPKRAFGHNGRTSADFAIRLSIHNNNILCNDRITKNRFHQTLHLIQVESGSEMECC